VSLVVNGRFSAYSAFCAVKAVSVPLVRYPLVSWHLGGSRFQWTTTDTKGHKGRRRTARQLSADCADSTEPYKTANRRPRNHAEPHGKRTAELAAKRSALGRDLAEGRRKKRRTATTALPLITRMVRIWKDEPLQGILFGWSSAISVLSAVRVVAVVLVAFFLRILRLFAAIVRLGRALALLSNLRASATSADREFSLPLYIRPIRAKMSRARFADGEWRGCVLVIG
jgi:hypothetical protein